MNYKEKYRKENIPPELLELFNVKARTSFHYSLEVKVEFQKLIPYIKKCNYFLELYNWPWHVFVDETIPSDHYLSISFYELYNSNDVLTIRPHKNIGSSFIRFNEDFTINAEEFYFKGKQLNSVTSKRKAIEYLKDNEWK